MKRLFNYLGERLNRISSLELTFLAVLSALVVGAFIIVVSDIDNLRDGDIVGALSTVGSAYWALVVGSFGSLRAISNTINSSTPLILCGISVAVAFKAGLFNIGATGQMLAGGMTALWVGFAMDGPGYIQVPLAIIAGAVGGAIFGAIPGILKARTGALEVITTIMLNYVMVNLFSFLLLDQNLLQGAETGGNTKADPAAETARLPLLLGENFSLHLGFILALVAVVVYWWLLERSTIGFRMRAVGFNPSAAKTAGIKVERTYIVALALSAAFIGVAGANQALAATGGVSPSSHSGIGFDAITVALLGGSSAPGVLLAGLLFGAFKAGGASVQAAGISPDVLAIIQGAIVLFIAAPPLIRAIFRLPSTPSTSNLNGLRARIFGGKGSK
jgi:simple sugar transport system permease protein